MEAIMTKNKNNMDVTKSTSRRLLRAGALFAAAGTMVLLTTGTAAGQTADTGATTRPATTQPTGQPPAMVSDGVSSEGGIHLTPGKSVIVNLRHSVKDPQFNIPNPEIADITPMSWTSFLVTGKKPGVMAIVVFDKETGRSQIVDLVVEPDLAMLAKQIKHAFPSVDITLTSMNDSIAVRGQVPSAMVAEQIVEMAGTFGKVHNFLDISGGQQVMLQVRYAEVSKSALRSLGVTFGGTDGISSVATNGLSNAALSFTGAQPNLGVSPAAAGSGVTIFGQGRFGVAAFDYFISALRTDGLVRTLAEPNVIAESGTTATMLAGGQVPIPVPQPGNGGSTITIEYHDYGVRLNFTPQILGNGKIKLKVSPEVSDLDYSVGVSVAGTTVPGFTDRKVDTTVELGDGQSFALAGLLDNKISASNTAIPLLGDIPILGALFTSTSYQRNETELVVLVTPRLVSAMNPDAVPALPGEKWRYPNQLQNYLFHDLGGPANAAKSRADIKTEGQPPQFHGSYGFTAVGTGSVIAVDPTPAK
jgi:pilus assembly protein CpaC